jgi:Zn-dependent M28 family amino/carboxypeptidase
VQARTDPSHLKKKLERIVGERNPFTSPRRLAEVESYIEKELKSLGLTVESDPFTYWGRSYRNIIARGRAHPNETMVILGAHFDSVEQTPGADDNASGVAVLLEAARLLTGARLRHQLVFCAFNLEEQNMIGSTHLAKKLKNAGAKISAMISLEMVGFTDRRPGSQKYPPGLSWFYPEQGDFIGVVGNWRSYSLLKKFTRLMRQTAGLRVESLTVFGNGSLIPAVRLSDHSPFWDAGYPALLVTDTSFFRNPHYHRSSDTIQTLDLDFMVKVCEGVVTAVLNL